MQLTCLARCSCLAGQILISKCCLQLRCPWQKKKTGSAWPAIKPCLVIFMDVCIQTLIQGWLLMAYIELTSCVTGLEWLPTWVWEWLCLCVIYKTYTRDCGGVVVFLIKIVHHDRPWFCSGLHHVAYVPAATHVRTTDAGKVVELSVTRHHTGSLVWLMRKFSVWNFHGSKVYARDKKNWGCHTLPPWCYQVGVLLFFTYHYFTYYLSKIVHHDRP